MKPVPLVLLITSVLLSHIPLSFCRPRDLNSLHNQLDDLLLGRPGGGGGGDAMSVLMGEKLLQYLQRSAQRAGGALHLPAPQQDNSLEELSEFSKRNDDPPISIDLTFHLLRNMIEMARIENQREQAELNRKYLDEVGK
ncbi:urotensin 1 precursor [Danio rerio]|uniref:Urotensin 1 n=1 Tax=Danio rerio TaxID=7955 RepID=Q5TZ50_DANRE|nr:urotensin 1 precursor [Danio rerio]|eukprot:NP_001025351.1 urocortin precursor [Danio rerio]